MAESLVTPIGVSDSASLYSELTDALEGFWEQTRVRGCAYALEGRVDSPSREADVIAAHVRGNNRYRTLWRRAGRGWTPDCSCPVAPLCKHAYALACVVLLRARADGEFDDPRLSRLLPSEAEWERGAGGTRAAGSPTDPDLRADGSMLEQLRTARRSWQRESALDGLLAGCPVQTLNPYTSPLVDVLEEPDPDVLCWRLAREIHALSGGWLPDELIPYRDRSDIAARYAELAGANLIEDLLGWGERRGRLAARTLRLAFHLDRDEAGNGILSCELRVTSARLQDEPRNMVQLQQLRNEFRSSPGSLSAEEGALLEWFADHCSLAPGTFGESVPRYITSSFASLLERVSDTPLACWAETVAADLVARAGIQAGSGVRFRRDAARFLPVLDSRQGEPWLALRLVWADGRERWLEDVVFLPASNAMGMSATSIVVADGEVSVLVEEPPASLLEGFSDLGGIRVPSSRRAEVIASLVAGFPHLQNSLRRHTRLFRTRPVIALDLGDNDWLQARLFAVAGDERWMPGVVAGEGTVVFEDTPELGWVRRDGAAARVVDPKAAAYALVEGREGEAPPAGGDVTDAEKAVPLAVTDAEKAVPLAETDTEKAVPLAETDTEKAVPLAETDTERAVPLAETDTEKAVPLAETDTERAVPLAETDTERAVPLAETTNSEDETWLDAPDPQCVETAVAWLRSLPFQARPRGAGGGQAAKESDATCWWMRVNARRLELLADAWERRPAEAAFFGTERLRRLLAARRTARPRVRVASSGVDWFTVSADWQREGRNLSQKDLLKLRTSPTRFVRLASGWVPREEATEQDEAATLLADLGLDPDGGEQKVTLWQLAGASPGTLERLESLGLDDETVQAVSQLRERMESFRGVPEIPLPLSVRAEMRPYQRQALDFLAYASQLGLGTVLADDMGLGKTLQALAWLAWLRETDPKGGPSLVVCPASVVHNWEREAARFTPELRVLLLTRGSDRQTLHGEVSDHDLVVTNYSLLRRDIEEWRSVELQAAILDEAQFIKNPDAAVTRAAGSLRARHRLALTGTPLENRALDLWSIVHFVNPGYLGPRGRFQANFGQPDAPPHVNGLLAAKLRPVLLRRTKKQVARELPERIEERYDCEMTRAQRHLYLAELRQSRTVVEQSTEGKGGFGRNQISVLAALTRLRQVCCHPALVGGSEEIGSGKFEALFELIEPILAEGHKILLFSQFVRCLNLLATDMRNRGIRHHLLTGQTRKREQVVDAFQDESEASVFLISLKAGGTGLNLTRASYVVLFDPWWNPAVEAQAIDRTHRIGQDRTVIAYRMLTRGTVEEKIWELQQRKASMARDILDEGVFARTLTRDDLNFLLTET